MLLKIDKGFSANEIVSLKLLNGDEIIARFVSETADEYSVSQILAITVTASGLGMIPWVFLGEKETVSLKKSHVFAIMPSKKDAAKQYLEGTTSIALI